MVIDLGKQDLINLVLSVTPKNMQECCDLTKVNLMEFCGNQHNENWRWKKDVLNNMNENNLWKLYQKYK